jgi:glutathione peroxidase
MIRMSPRQKIIKLFYPLLMRMGKKFRKNTMMKYNSGHIGPAVSFYTLNTVANNGDEISFNSFRGKKVLLVNTASDCGYTPQYEELQTLHEQFPDNLVIIGFPANDFGQQEKGDDPEIAQFCKVNFGVSFPLAKKSTVIRSPMQNRVYEWLTDRKENGWNDQEPTWNFSKYLVNEQGILTYYFDPSLSPMGEEMRNALGK